MSAGGPERTPDGRYVVIDGRRWRATDPGIPDDLRRELVGELMAARRAVGSATDELGTARARARVHDAKIALGERGAPWWDEATSEALATRVTAIVETLRRARGSDGLVAATDVMGVLCSPGWQPDRETVDAAVAKAFVVRE